MGLFSKLFKPYSEKQINKIIPLVDAVEALSDRFHSFSDEELHDYTDTLKNRLNEGETLDDILPEAFALVREADERVLGKRPYRVQIMDSRQSRTIGLPGYQCSYPSNDKDGRTSTSPI